MSRVPVSARHRRGIDRGVEKEGKGEEGERRKKKKSESGETREVAKRKESGVFPRRVGQMTKGLPVFLTKGY